MVDGVAGGSVEMDRGEERRVGEEGEDARVQRPFRADEPASHRERVDDAALVRLDQPAARQARDRRRRGAPVQERAELLDARQREDRGVGGGAADRLLPDRRRHRAHATTLGAQGGGYHRPPGEVSEWPKERD